MRNVKDLLSSIYACVAYGVQGIPFSLGTKDEGK